MISALLGDITLIPTEAIVNSANPSLLAEVAYVARYIELQGPTWKLPVNKLGGLTRDKQC